MFQVCPLCKGEGKYKDSNIVVGQLSSTICPVCEGKRIINELTGLPPVHTVASTSSTTHISNAPIIAYPPNCRDVKSTGDYNLDCGTKQI